MCIRDRSRYESTIYEWDLQASEAVAYWPSFVPSYVSGLRITCMLLGNGLSLSDVYRHLHGTFEAAAPNSPATPTPTPTPTPTRRPKTTTTTAPLLAALSVLHSPCYFPSTKKRQQRLKACRKENLKCRSRGAGIGQRLERLTRDWKVPGSIPGRSGRRIFFSRVNFLCWLLFRYPFHPGVSAVARKRSRSFRQKCRWQVTAKQTDLCGFE